MFFGTALASGRYCWLRGRGFSGRLRPYM